MAVPRALASSSVRRKVGSPARTWTPPRPDGESGRGGGRPGRGRGGGSSRGAAARPGRGAGAGGGGGGPVVGEGRGCRRRGPGSRPGPSGAIASRTRSCQALAAGRAGGGGAGAADDEPGPGAGEADVEQAAALLADEVAAGVLGGGEGRGGAVGADLPDRLAAGEAEDLRRVGAVVADGGVGEDDDGGLEALGAVHGHDPDLVGGLLGAALDRHLLAVEPGEEAGEARGLDALVGQRLVDQRVDAVLGLGAEAGGEPAAAVVADEDAGEELVGAEVVGLGEEVGEERAHLGPAVGGCSRRARQRLALAGMGELEEVALGEAAERAAQERGEREVVARGWRRRGARRGGR